MIYLCLLLVLVYTTIGHYHNPYLNHNTNYLTNRLSIILALYIIIHYFLFKDLIHLVYIDRDNQNIIMSVLCKGCRKTKINELPQLWNILKGDISFVGPRPLTPNTFEFYSIDIQKNLTSICPGLTGVGSIVFRDEESLINFSLKKPEIFYKEDIAPYKGTLETWFSDNININVYFKIILLTVWVIIFPKSNLIYRVFPELPSKPNNLKLE